MTTEACREMRAALGAAALGGLDPAEEVALRAHLEGCAACRDELRALAAVARALPVVDPDRIAHTPAEPPHELAARVLARVARERQARRAARRRRVLARAGIAAAAAAAALAVVVGLALTRDDPGERALRIAFPSGDGVTASAVLHPRPTGTEVTFHAAGLHDGEVYWLWLTGDDRRRVTAGTFRGTDRPVDVTMTASIRLRDTRRVWVTDEADAVVLDIHLPPG
jgi:anti-sigma-K factor RskA